ncbi:MAG: hypothetical protein A2033_17595 [Bacteroidetes bacterium GWA2_31_9]|nr:MAG: hypothetical protein A2033_17595 [Bacteroidetes bacterium GWA2_31_9]
MKKGWEIKKLHEVAEYFNGLTYSPKDVSDKGTIVLRSSNIQNDKLDFSDIVRVSVSVKEKLFVRDSDILMCSRNGSQRLVGKTAPILNLKEPMTFGTFMMIIRSEFSSYLLWYFKTDEFKKQISGGENTMINQVTRYMLDEIEIPLPPLPEQQRIVAILDKTFATITKAKNNAERNLKNAKELFESYLQSVFENGNWEVKSLEEICDLISKGSSPKWQGIKYVDEPEVLFVTSENVGENTLLLNERKYVEKKFNIKEKKSILMNGDVLTNIVGASIGRTAIYNLDDVANINQAVCLIRCNKHLLFNEYLMYLLNSPFTKQHLHENEVNNARANLSLGFFRSLTIPFPELAEQKIVVNKIKGFHIETKKSEAIYLKKIADLEELKKSILQKAFCGELVKSLKEISV